MFRRSTTLIIKRISSTAAHSPASYRLAPRVHGQLVDPRMRTLAGKLSSFELARLANCSAAQVYLDGRTHHVNVVQVVGGRLLRITFAADSAKIISVGPIKVPGIRNAVIKRRCVPIFTSRDQALAQIDRLDSKLINSRK